MTDLLPCGLPIPVSASLLDIQFKQGSPCSLDSAQKRVFKASCTNSGHVQSVKGNDLAPDP